MTISIHFRLFMLLTFLLAPSVTLAQMEPGDMQSTEAPFLINSLTYNIHFIHKPDAKPNEATLRISQPFSINGCADIQPLATEIKTVGRNLKVIISDPIIKLDKKTQYAQFRCQQKMNSVTADITLNRDHIAKHNINKITFKSSAGQDRYDLHLGQNSLSLFTKGRDPLTKKEIKISSGADKILFKPSKLTQRKNPLTYWFYPDNLVLVYPAHPPVEKDISTRISLLAKKNGLVEAEKIIPGFSSPLTDQNVLYFIDETGDLGHKLRAGGPAPLGKITINEVFQGHRGAYDKKKKLVVYARTPGLLD